jgi:hypothetical protein
MSEASLPAEKIRDDELRRFAVDKSPEQRTVFVALRLPPRQVQLSKSGPGEVARPVRVKPETPDERAQRERMVTEASKFLQDELGESPQWLSAARAFQIKANGEQLSRIAMSELVEAILPNRALRMRSASEGAVNPEQQDRASTKPEPTIADFLAGIPKGNQGAVRAYQEIAKNEELLRAQEAFHSMFEGGNPSAACHAPEDKKTASSKKDKPKKRWRERTATPQDLENPDGQSR